MVKQKEDAMVLYCEERQRCPPCTYRKGGPTAEHRTQPAGAELVKPLQLPTAGHSAILPCFSQTLCALSYLAEYNPRLPSSPTAP